MFFAKTSRRNTNLYKFSSSGANFWVDTAYYLGETLDTRLTWTTYTDQMRKQNAPKTGSVGSSSLQYKWSLHQERSPAV